MHTPEAPLAPPTVETPRLLLRPWLTDDAEALYALARHPAIGRAAGWPPHTSVEQSREIITTVFAAPEIYAVVSKATGAIIGCCGLIFGNDKHNPFMQAADVELGYWLGRTHWGRGYATEAAKALIERAFSRLGATAVWISFYEENARSRKVAEKCGCVFSHAVPADANAPGDARTEVYTVLTADAYRRTRQS